MYANANSWGDKAMLIKAIGDFCTKESREFITQVKGSFSKNKEIEWGNDLINLYLL